MPIFAPRTVAVALALGILLAGCSRSKTPPPPPPTSESPVGKPPAERVVGPLSEADAAALATMNGRLKAYVELHEKLDRSLPKLIDSATPKEIDTNQRQLEVLMREARSGAKQGDIFTPQAQPVIKRLLAAVFGGPEGKQLKASIMDENPVDVKVSVNSRYPDTVPVSSVPPQVLQTLPALSEDMEYRFVGDRIVLFDVHAHIIADYIDDALPK
jgi:hypothetical protein